MYGNCKIFSCLVILLGSGPYYIWLLKLTEPSEVLKEIFGDHSGEVYPVLTDYIMLMHRINKIIGLCPVFNAGLNKGKTMLPDNHRIKGPVNDQQIAQVLIKRRPARK